MRQKYNWNLLLKILVVIAVFFVTAFVLIQRNISSYSGFVYKKVQDVPTSTVALIFGAGLRRNGTPSDALADRVLAGVDLYKAGKVRKLLMTGDNGSKAYDEVTAMKKLALSEGVPETDIVLDYAGFDTYDSCYRAREVFGLWSVTAVSQEFHLPRVLFTCNSLGVETVGYMADRRLYVAAGSWRVRESLARVKAWYEVKISQPLPTYLGRKEKVF